MDNKDLTPTDKIIKEFMKTRFDKDEIKILKSRPSMLGDLILFAFSPDMQELMKDFYWNKSIEILSPKESQKKIMQEIFRRHTNETFD